MNDSSTVLLAALGIVSTAILALIWIIKYLFTEFKPVMENLVKVTEANTLATKAADAYLQQRNGQDAEFHKEVMTKLKDIPVQAEKQAEKVAIELKKQTEAVSSLLEVNTDSITSELKRVGDLTEERVEIAKHASEHQTVIEQTVNRQIINK